MAQGGIGLLSIAAANAEDPQTLRMIAGAIANLCGNGKPGFGPFNSLTFAGLAENRRFLMFSLIAVICYTLYLVQVY